MKLTTKFNAKIILLFIYISSVCQLYGDISPYLLVISVIALFFKCANSNGLFIYLNYYIIWGVIFFLICVASIFYGNDWLGAAYGTRGFLECLLSGIVLITITKDTNYLRLYINVTIVSLVLLIIKCIFICSYDEILNRSFGGLINANAFAMMLAFGALMLNAVSTKKNIVQIITIGCFLLFSILAASKKSLIIIFVGFFVMNIVTKCNTYEITKKIIVVCFVFIVVFLLITYTSLLESSIAHRVIGFFDFLKGESGDASTSERAELISMALNGFFEYPIFGQGINSFANIINYKGTGIYSHCNYAELLFGVGLVGCVTYYSIFIYLMLILMRIRNQDKYWPLIVAFVLVIPLIDVGVVSYGDEFIQFLISFVFCYLKTIKIKPKNNYE